MYVATGLNDRRMDVDGKEGNEVEKHAQGRRRQENRRRTDKVELTEVVIGESRSNRDSEDDRKDAEQ